MILSSGCLTGYQDCGAVIAVAARQGRSGVRGVVDGPVAATTTDAVVDEAQVRISRVPFPAAGGRGIHRAANRAPEKGPGVP